MTTTTTTTAMTPVETVRQALDAVKKGRVSFNGLLSVYVRPGTASALDRLIDRAGGCAIVLGFCPCRGTQVDFTIGDEADAYLLNADATIVHSLDRGVEPGATIHDLFAKSAGWSTFQYVGPARRSWKPGGIRVRRIQASGKINSTISVVESVRFTTFETYTPATP